MLFNPTKAKNYDGSQPLIVTDDHDHQECSWSVDKDFTVSFEIAGNEITVARIGPMEVMTVDGFLPELRYNSVLDGWFCVSPNVVKEHDFTTDEKEAEYLNEACKADPTLSSAGVFKSVVEAIAYWNRQVVDWLWVSSYMLMMDPRECVI